MLPEIQCMCQARVIRIVYEWGDRPQDILKEALSKKQSQSQKKKPKREAKFYSLVKHFYKHLQKKKIN